MLKSYCRNTFLLFAAAGLLAGSFCMAADTRPNVLFIAVDDLNVWVTHLGRNPQSRTPNIDGLAARGVTFRHAYCAVPACEPSRAALMGGRRASTTGCYYNGNHWKNHVPEGTGLTAQFLKAGYYVGGAGKIYHGDQYYPSEWTEYFDTKGLSASGKGVDKNEGFHDPLKHDLKDQDLNDWQITDWCIEQLGKKRSQPFFIACGLHKPHLPFAVPRKYYERFPLDSIQLPPYREDDLDDITHQSGIHCRNGAHTILIADNIIRRERAEEMHYGIHLREASITLGTNSITGINENIHIPRFLKNTVSVSYSARHGSNRR